MTMESGSRHPHAAETRKQILAAAQALFVAQGYGATSVAQIADQAGVALKTVYLGVPDQARPA
jgi:AcrR family transcriptional regulator